MTRGFYGLVSSPLADSGWVQAIEMAPLLHFSLFIIHNHPSIGRYSICNWEKVVKVKRYVVAQSGLKNSVRTSKNTRFHGYYQAVNASRGNNRYSLWESKETHEYTMSKVPIYWMLKPLVKKLPLDFKGSKLLRQSTNSAFKIIPPFKFTARFSPLTSFLQNQFKFPNPHSSVPLLQLRTLKSIT
jgi:hypothetical protein